MWNYAYFRIMEFCNNAYFREIKQRMLLFCNIRCSVCRQSLQTESEEEKRRLIVRSRIRRRTMYGRVRERTKAVTASTYVLAVKKLS